MENYIENPKKLERKIYPLLLRFCSIHNDLGDRFTIGQGENKQLYDLIENNFPFNINIACIGRSKQGKSSVINTLLKEYKAKEGSSQTKDFIFYKVKNYPIKIIEIPGFYSEKTVNNTFEKYKNFNFRGGINLMKESIHIILYCLQYYEKRTFMKLEYPILEEITKDEKVKIIYVITYSSPDVTEIIKKEILRRINFGIREITKISIQMEKFSANDNNIVFVNLHKNIFNGEELFGQKELFEKIYDTFSQSEDYINSLKIKKEDINIKALKLRDIAKESLSSNKIFDELVSFIPFAGSALKKFVIKKNAVKKVEQIFGIDVELLVKDTHASYEDYSYEELLDKFVDYYKNMAERYSNIFKNGLDIF